MHEPKQVDLKLSDNPKSDVNAKQAFRQELLRRGYDTARITRAPADITATKGDDTFYFEIKFTKQSQKYFGAATLTEWEAAICFENRFFFVIAFMRNGEWIFHEYTPSEFMEMSYVPPFKVFFNVEVMEEKSVSARETSRSVKLSRKRLTLMVDLFRQLRRGEE